jgi:bacterioferritin-associated ferredoxin
MILCSCNALSSNTVKQILDNHSGPVPSVQEIMNKHGCSVECATCAHNIKIEIRKHYESLHRTLP